MTVSPPSREPIGRHEAMLMEIGTKRIEPSSRPTRTRPVCARFAFVEMRPGGYMHDRVFGSEMW